MYRATADLIVHLLATRAIRVGCSVACRWSSWCAIGEMLVRNSATMTATLAGCSSRNRCPPPGTMLHSGVGDAAVADPFGTRSTLVWIGSACAAFCGPEALLFALFAQPVQGADLRSHRPALAATTVVASSSSNASRERRTASRRRLVRDLAQASMARSKRLTCTGSATPRG